MQLNRQVYEVLRYKLGFSNAELRSNIQLITELQKMDLEAFLEFLDRNKSDFCRAENPKAYTIGALKKYYKFLHQKKERQATASVAREPKRGGETKPISELIRDM